MKFIPSHSHTNPSILSKEGLQDFVSAVRRKQDAELIDQQLTEMQAAQAANPPTSSSGLLLLSIMAVGVVGAASAYYFLIHRKKAK